MKPIIIAISLLWSLTACGRTLEQLIALQNTQPDLAAETKLCVLPPLAMNGVSLESQLSAPIQFKPQAGKLCAMLESFKPYELRYLKVNWELGAKEDSLQGLGINFPRSHSPELSELAASFEQFEHKDRPSRIHQWLLENIAFTGIRRSVDGALYALKAREGDCTEHMLLAAELLQRNGYVVRRALGAAIRKNERRITPLAMHNWVEYRVGKNWLILDSTQVTLGVPPGYDYVSFFYYEDSQGLGIMPLSVDQENLKLHLR